MKYWLSQNFDTGISKSSRLTSDLSSIWKSYLKNKELLALAEPDLNESQLIKDIRNGVKLKSKQSKSKSQDFSEELEIGLLARLEIDTYRSYPENCEKLEFGKINLITGSNGYGKTSLLEAIELIITGSTQRGDLGTGYKISATNSKMKNLKIPTNTELQRQRDRAWYESVQATRLSKVNANFHRYNFYNSDAAFRLSIPDNKNTKSIEDAFKEIALGQEINSLKKNLVSLQSKIQKEIKTLQKDKLFIISNIENSKETLKEIEQNKTDSSGIFKTLITSLNKQKWMMNLPKKPEDDMSDVRYTITKLLNLIREIKKNVPYFPELTLKSFSSEESHIAMLLIEIQSLNEKIKTSKKELKEKEREQVKIKRKIDLIKKLIPYFEEESIEQILNIESEISSLNQQIRALDFDIEEQKKLNLNAFLKDDKVVLELLTEVTLNISAENKKLESTNKSLEALSSSKTDLENVLSQFSRLSEDYISLNKVSSDCPVCNTVFKNVEELNKNIKKKRKELVQDVDLSKLRKEADETSSKVLELQNKQSALEEVKRVFNIEKSSKLTANYTIKDCLAQIGGDKRQLKEKNKSVGALNSIVNQFKIKSLSKIEYIELLDQKESYKKLSKITELDEFKEKLKYFESKFKQNKISIKKREEEIESYENDIADKPNKYFSIDSKLSQEEQLESVLKTIMHYRSKLTEQDIRIKLGLKTDLQKIYDDLLESGEHLSQFDKLKKEQTNESSILKKELKSIKSSETKLEEIKVVLKRFEKVDSDLKTLFDEHSDTEYFLDFLKQNEAEISNIFMAIHSPKEFKKLEFLDGKISLTKSNDDFVTINKISTGQRSALALATFLVLNKKIINDPKQVILDDPIAFVDDLNALSFLDYLREYLIDNPEKQLFFATANDNLAFLFRKKFSMFKSNFKEISLSRASM